MTLPKTGIKEDILSHIGKAFSETPADFVVHPGKRCSQRNVEVYLRVLGTNTIVVYCCSMQV